LDVGICGIGEQYAIEIAVDQISKEQFLLLFYIPFSCLAYHQKDKSDATEDTAI
jgi:hypothetical protein